MGWGFCLSFNDERGLTYNDLSDMRIIKEKKLKLSALFSHTDHNFTSTHNKRFKI